VVEEEVDEAVVEPDTGSQACEVSRPDLQAEMIPQ
jgi:hypothetical protein